MLLVAENLRMALVTEHVTVGEIAKHITKDKIKNIWKEKNEALVHRSKWIYQQFLKLLSFKVIENLSN